MLQHPDYTRAGARSHGMGACPAGYVETGMRESIRPDDTASEEARAAMRRLRIFGRQALADAEQTGAQIEDLATTRERRGFRAFSAGFGIGTVMGALAVAAFRKNSARE